MFNDCFACGRCVFSHCLNCVVLTKCANQSAGIISNKSCITNRFSQQNVLTALRSFYNFSIAFAHAILRYPNNKTQQ